MPARKDPEYWRKRREHVKEKHPGIVADCQQCRGADMTNTEYLAADEQVTGHQREESLGALMSRLPPDAQEALLLGIRTGSPVPWREYLARRERAAR